MMLCVVRGLSLPGGRSRVSDPQPCVSSGVVWLLGVGVHAHVAQPSVGDWRWPDHSSCLVWDLSSSGLCPMLGHLASWNSDLSLECGSDKLYLSPPTIALLTPWPGNSPKSKLGQSQDSSLSRGIIALCFLSSVSEKCHLIFFVWFQSCFKWEGKSCPWYTSWLEAEVWGVLMDYTFAVNSRMGKTRSLQENQRYQGNHSYKDGHNRR